MSLCNWMSRAEVKICGIKKASNAGLSGRAGN